MAELVDQLAHFFEVLILAVGYPGIFAMTFLENAFPPVPTEPLIPFAGMLAGQGKLNFLLVWMFALAGMIAGSLVLYGFGRWADDVIIRRVVRRYGRYMGVTEEHLERALSLFRQYGAPVVLLGRAIPVLKGAISITAGMSRMSVIQFTLLIGLNAGFTSGFWAYMGYLLGENWDRALELIDTFQPMILGAGAVILLGFVLVYLRRARRSRQPL